MGRWKRRGGTLAFGALLVGLLVGAGPSVAAADTAAPARVGPAPRTVVVTVVRARDLMSAEDRQTYREAMREAPDQAARQRVQAEWLEKLQARATEHGVVMIIQAPELRPGLRRVETGQTAAPGAVVVRPAEPPAPPPPPRAP